MTQFTSGQIVLENTYPNTSFYLSSTNLQQLYMIKLEVDSAKYVHVDRNNKVVNFYNLDHTLWKTISFSLATDLNSGANAMDIMYISQHLFDTDDEIEFLYSDQFGSGSAVTQIVNEDGTILFTANNEAPVVKMNAPQAQLPIYNTSAGTKMILSNTNGDSKVYGLPGTLSSIVPISTESQNMGFLIYPNPSNSTFKISTKNSAIKKIQISDENGKTIKIIEFSSVLNNEIDISTLSVGIYFVQLIDTKGELIETQKLIKN